LTRLFTASQLAEAGLLRGILEAEGIPCTVRNEYAAMAVGRIPFQEAQPELWVLNEADLPRAQRLLDAWRSAADIADDDTDWLCPDCGEEIEAPLGLCWNCGAERPT
jgi:hypothetical protein